jgi:hypothetical protein
MILECMKIPSALFVAALLTLPAASAADADKPVEQKDPGNVVDSDDSSHKEAADYISGKVAWPKDAERAQDKAVALTIQLVLNDPNAAAALWANFLTDVEKKAEAEGKADPNAVMSLHRSLMQDLAETSASFPAICQFLMKVGREPAGIHLGTWETALGDALTERYSAFPQVMDGGTEQSLFQTSYLRGLVHFFQATAKDTPLEARPTLAALGLYQLCRNWRFHEYWNDRQAAVEWADTTLKPLHPLLADAMVTAILSTEHWRLNAQQENELRQRVLRLLNSPELTTAEKISLFSQLVNSSEHLKYDRPELVKALAATMETFLEHQQSLPDTKTLHLLAEITEYSALTKEDAATLFSRLQRLAPSGSAIPVSDENPVELLGRIGLNLALRAGDPGEIAAAVKATASQIHGRLEVALKLWRAGQGALAAGVLAGPNEYLEVSENYFLEKSTDGFIPPAFNREIETHLNGWLESIDDRGQRFRAECVMSSLTDEEGANAPKENRVARQDRLIDRFAAEAPHARAARLETLAALSFSDKSVQLRDEMAKMAGNLDWAQVTRRSGPENPNERNELRVMVQRGMRYRIDVDGDGSYFLKQVRAISAAGGKRSSGWNDGDDLRFNFSYFAGLLCRKVMESPPEMQAGLLESARKVCESFLAAPDDYSRAMGPGFVIMAHAAGNAGAALDDWHAKLPANLREAYDHARGAYGLPNNLRIMRSWPLLMPTKTAQRRELLKRFLCDPATVKREIQTPSEVSYMLDFELFNKDDLFAVLDDLPKDHPMRVKFFAEKAGMLGNRLGTEQEAMAAFDAAEKMAKESSDPTDLAYVLAVKAKYFGDDLHRPEQAEALIKTIDPKFLDQREKDWIEDFSAKQKK